MPSSATLAAGTLSLHPAPPSRSGGPPSPRLDGEGGEARGGLWDYYFFFFTLRKNASAGEGGEEGSKFLPLCYRSCLAKAETEKALWPGKATCELGAPLAEVGWGMRGGANVCPGSRVKGLALSCRELLGLHELCKAMPLFTLTPGVFCRCGKCRRFKQGSAKDLFRHMKKVHFQKQ